MHGDVAATVNNIAAHEWLFRFGIVADLIGAVVLIFLVLAFYRLFKDVDQYLAMLVVILGGVMPALLYFVNVVSDSGALMIARGADFLSVFDKPQRDALVVLLLRLHDAQNTAAENALGAMAYSAGDPGVQVAFPATLSGRLAGHQRLRLCGPVLDGRIVSAVFEQGFSPRRSPRSLGSWRLCCGW